MTDSELVFSDEQAVSETAISEYVHKRSIVDNSTTGFGAQGLYLVVKCANTAATEDGGTLTFKFVSDTAVGLATSTTEHIPDLTAIAAASLTAGAVLYMGQIPVNDDYKQFIGLKYTVANNFTTAPKIIAYLTKNPQAWKSYASRQSLTP